MHRVLTTQGPSRQTSLRIRGAGVVALALALLGPNVPAQGAGAAVLVGAGDISNCSTNADGATAALMDDVPGTVFTLGDHVYNRGTKALFWRCYAPTWGRHKARTRPAVGNHDYRVPGAAGYFDYFGAAAGPRGKGWYSYNLGAWHIVVLNSNCEEVGGCGPGSAQERWLRADLAASRAACTLAYWHHPRFSSDDSHGNEPAAGAFWEALYDHGAEVVLAGHAHVYERFAPQTPRATASSAFGIREFVVGSGGVNHYGFKAPQPNSQVRNGTAFGVLKLTLYRTGYEWRFLAIPGQNFTDTGRGSCHGRP